MKILIASDIHGDAVATRLLLRRFSEERADKLLLLGDILYHGPRNDLPTGYAPKEVISMLNEYKEKILTVRGNCDAEVDEMVLAFPVRADYALLSPDEHTTIFATHGHLLTKETAPLEKGECFLQGHTHVAEISRFGNENLFVNPGSTSIPKGDFPASYAVYENGAFAIKALADETLLIGPISVCQ